MYKVEHIEVLNQTGFTDTELEDISAFKRKLEDIISRSDDAFTKKFYTEILNYTDEKSFDFYVSLREDETESPIY